MAEDVENHTIRLLQEMRAEMRDARAEMKTGFAEVERQFTEMNERFDDITLRVDGNTLILNMLAGLVAHHEERIDALEEARG